ncbi:MAG: iron-sulfur cluster-binding protein [Armatimonadetes bacterium]|nr:iron-sulfur cluster-binding protein [Armatimonadota bacterium]
MSLKGFDEFVQRLDEGTVQSVRSASVSKTDARVKALSAAFDDPEAARKHASEVKAYVLDHWKELLLQLEETCTANGITVHWAADAESARQTVLDLCRKAPGRLVVKAKSMATEEIHLNAALEGAGFEVVETDLGEFVVQIDGDTPSHIVTPIIHKDRRQVARSFVEHGLGDYTESPEGLAMQARDHLRGKFRRADVGISGVNFAIAESGRIVLVENEGNNRLSTTAPKRHIAVMGIEKLLPRDADLPLFLRLLAGSATGQRLTVYTHLISGPRASEDLDGPESVHLVLLDNGRSRIASGPYRDILKCIRCGACLNTCPVYRQGSGHAYGHVYSGPVGAVLAPALEGVEALGALAKASTLCGACEEVCPVAIPIPRMLLQLREEARRAGQGDPVPWRAFAWTAERDAAWRGSLTLLPLATRFPNGWNVHRERLKRVGRTFRGWWRGRS